MSDRVKIVVEIPKEVFEARKVGEISPWVTTPILDSVQNGKPLSEVLDEIRTEIEEKAHSDNNAIYRDGLLYALYVINKHTKDEEMSK